MRLGKHVKTGRVKTGLVIAGALLAVGVVAAQAAAAQERPTRLEVWDIVLGSHAGDLPSREFIELACGTNGGPPSRPLKGFADFRKCRPEDSGFYEVFFRYDDQPEYWARAQEAPTLILLYAGTTAYSRPVIVSALIDGDGIVKGFRLVTDPDTTIAKRRDAYTLRNFLFGRYGDNWACVDEPPGERRSPVGTLFVDQQCTTEWDGTDVFLVSHFFRKPGQAAHDLRTGVRTEGQFESSARLEVFLQTPTQ
jgi:hypothetical protein